jgi:tRNA threonylcarbamoyladenosine biosynthesis protein TsaB
MKLFINTSDSNKTVVGLDDKRWEFDTKQHKSQRLLDLINRTLRKEKRILEELTVVEVNLGPGSFTGLRVGVAVANALGWVLKIPVNDKKVGEAVEPKYGKS